MPRDVFKELSRDEQRFVFHYLREGATQEAIPMAERKCRLAKGLGKAMLTRRHVQEEIARRKALVEFEEHKQIARDKARLAEEEDKRIKEEEARRQVTQKKLEEALAGLVELDPKLHGAIVLQGIKLGFVYTGTIRDGRIVRMATEEPTKPQEDTEDQNPANLFYRSIFANKLQAEIQTEASPILPTDKPAFLDPSATLPPPPLLKIPPPSPAPEKPAKPKSGKNGITIT